MGKIADALERHDKEKIVKLDDVKEAPPKRLGVEEREVKEAPPKRLVVEEPEVKFARQITADLAHDQSFSDSLVMLSSPDSADAETFKVLRGQLLFPKDLKVPRSMLVTSTFPAEGKTYVVANLAATLAMSIDEYVLAVDADLRRPRLHRMFGYTKVKGLHEYLVENAQLDELIIKSSINKLSLLPAGKPPRNPTELLSSNMMVRFIEELKERYQDHFVIIDSPPSSVTTESKFISQHVDGVIYVVMANKTPRKDIEKAIDNLGRERIIGIVFNGYEQVRKSYHRYYDRYYKSKK